MFLTETWLRPSGDEAKCADLAPPGYSVHSFPRSPGAASCRGGGIAFIVRDSLKQNVSCSTSFPFYRSCFEVAQLTPTLHDQRYNFFCIYRPPPNKKNAFTDTTFIYFFINSQNSLNTVILYQAKCLLRAILTSTLKP